MTGLPRFSGMGVMVTGSSRGLGRALAVAFAAEGAYVTITYRAQADMAAETLAKVRETGSDGAMVRLDVRDGDAVKAAVSECDARRPLAVLVNNASIVHDQAFVLLSPSQWSDTLDTNLTGTYNCCRAALPAMMARGHGSIVNVASVAALRGVAGQAAYSASKGGVVSLTRSLAREVAPRGVRVNAVVPGLLDVGMGIRLDRRIVERRIADIPLARLGRADEAARAVLFLASDDASYIVGQTLTVDGGLSV